MKKLNILLLFIAAFGFQQLAAQPMTIDKLKAAEKELAKKEYYTALEWYLEAYEDGEDNIQDNVDVVHNIAMLYAQLRNWKKAESWYKKLMKEDEKSKFPNAGYYLGYAQKINGKYDEAVKTLDAFMAASGDATMKKMAETQKAGANLGKSLPAADPEIMVENKSTRNFSSAYTEWSPLYISATEMYYTGLKADKVFYETGGADDFSKLYKATKTGDDWSAGTVVGGTVINIKGAHTGNVTISDDGNYLYFTRCIYKGNSLEDCKIYVSKKEGGTWGEAQKLEGINDDKYTSKQPSFGKVNGKNAIFFASDMPGGQGGVDVYVAVMKSPTSVEPAISLGKEVNTIGNDETPFYKDDVLYFASNGQPGLGGYDLFSAEQTGVNWSGVENMGKSFNTAADELNFVLDKEGYHGFLVSNRKGTKKIAGTSTFDKEDNWNKSGDDIYQVTIDKPVLAGLDVRVFDKQNRPVKGVTVTIKEVVGSAAQEKTNPRGNKFTFPLEIEKQYQITATRGCYNSETTTISTKDLKESKTFVTEFVMNEVAPTIEKKTDVKKEVITTGQPIVLSNLFFDLGKDKIRPDAEPALTKVLNIMNQNPTTVIELSSHTDSRGSKPANQALSQRRAASSKKWLVTRGIAEDRIIAVGKGELELRNQCSDGVTCTEDEHQLNRRTEFKIVSGPKEITIENVNEEIITTYDTIPCPGLKDATGFIDVNSLKTTELVFEKESFDFGNVKKGETVEHTFVLTNIGKEDLIIEFASGSCGCTVPEFPKGAIKPGEKGEIKVIYTAKEDKEIGLEDQQEVTIIANTEPPVSLVTIKAKVTK
jgi:peptidoglycan-associated lipoprotein